MSKEFEMDMNHLHRVQRAIRDSASIFPNESDLEKALADVVNAAQDDNSMNTYYSMANYLKQRLKELNEHLETPEESVQLGLEELSWAITYLQWLVTEQKEDGK